MPDNDATCFLMNGDRVGDTVGDEWWVVESGALHAAVRREHDGRVVEVDQYGHGFHLLERLDSRDDRDEGEYE